MDFHLPSVVMLLPLLGALVGALAYVLPARLGAAGAVWAQGATTGSVMLACVGAWVVFFGLQHGTMAASNVTWFTWMQVAGWQVEMGALVDKLTATMLIVVTTVSACVHLYSWGYMAEDPSKRRFFIYLSLFTFAMLMLVGAPNLLQMFLGWEGVGVCSYLLIGFWHKKATANAAAMKAFIVNRVADAAMLLGIFLLLQTFGSMTYADFLPRVSEVVGDNQTTVNLIALLIFIGAMGKSAQFGLHTWLPDAMEGPTPVSALIHAATMVTAGVFLLCRLSPLYEAAPDVLEIVAWVGALTAIFAATVGLTQTDIKRVIAYSTCSQLGYMFFAIGVSAYPAAMFHLTTHAFFKALLFLGAGSVIHGMHHEQNLMKMGALRTFLPVTYGLMWLGSLALAGIPPFAGFFSKDLILESAFMAPDGWAQGIYVVGTLGAFLTAFYSFRVVFLCFHGKAHWGHDAKHGHHDDHDHTPHESPLVMLVAMLPLAFGALVGGWMLLDMTHLHWWDGAMSIAHAHTALEAAHYTPWLAKYFPLVVALGGIALSWWVYVQRVGLAEKMAKTWTLMYGFSLNKWYVDELYDLVVVRLVQVGSKWLARVMDAKVLDGLVNGVAAGLLDTGRLARNGQSGYVYHYAFVMVVGVVVGLAMMLWKV